MILKTEQDSSCDDIEIFIRYTKLDVHVEHVISLIQSIDTRIKGIHEGSERLINASDIYYIESVDKRTFIYLEKNVYQTEYRLYQLAEKLAPAGFVQISKSCILNLDAMECIKPLMNSRMEATLKNGERLLITRKYLSGIKKALQEGLIR